MDLLGGLNDNPAWIALIGTILGGVGLKFTEHRLGKSRTNSDDAKQIREELRSQITSQKEQINELEDEVNEWRSKYYDLRDSYVKAQTELTLALANIKEAERRFSLRTDSIDDTPALVYNEDSTLGENND